MCDWKINPTSAKQENITEKESQSKFSSSYTCVWTEDYSFTSTFQHKIEEIDEKGVSSYTYMYLSGGLIVQIKARKHEWKGVWKSSRPLAQLGWTQRPWWSKVIQTDRMITCLPRMLIRWCDDKDVKVIRWSIF